MIFYWISILENILNYIQDQNDNKKKMYSFIFFNKIILKMFKILFISPYIFYLNVITI